MFLRLAVEHPDNPWPLLSLARLDSRLLPFRHPLTAAGSDSADQELHLAGDNVQVSWRLAQLYYYAEDYDRASQAAQQALVAEPASSAAHYWAGQAAKRTGDLNAAEKHFMACADPATAASDWWSFSCSAELITATREMTITLHADHMMIQTQAIVNDPPVQVRDLLSAWTASEMGQYLAWGMTSIGPRGFYAGSGAQPAEIVVEPSKIIITDHGPRLEYDTQMLGLYTAGEHPFFTVQDVPLASYAYTMPTTVTVVSKGAEPVDASHPYTVRDGSQFSWQLAELTDTGNPLTVAVRPDVFNQLKLRISSNHQLIRSSFWIFWSLSTVLGLVAVAWIRWDAYHSQGSQVNNLKGIYRIFAPTSALSWLFDLVLAFLVGLTLLHPLWQIVEGYPYSDNTSYYVYVLALPVLLARLIVTKWDHNYQRDRSLVFLGAVLFACYLVPQPLLPVLPLTRLLVSMVVFWFVLVRGRKWLDSYDWQKLRELFTHKRQALVERVASLDQLPSLKRASRGQELALAKGEMTGLEYEESRRVLTQVIEKKECLLSKLRDELGIPSKEVPKKALFRLGPTSNPVTNGLAAVGFGMIPYLGFMILASITGDMWANYQGGLEPVELFGLAYDALGVAWGPLFLFFFGAYLHVLWGDYAVTKGLVFACALAVLHGVFLWLWQWNQADVVEFWGVAMRVVATFVFTGLMMDWMTAGFSWRQLIDSYGSPEVTTLITVIGTTIATVVVGLLTGTIEELLRIVFQGISAAVGTQPMPGP